MIELLKHDFKMVAPQWKRVLVILLFVPLALFILGPSPEFGRYSELYIHSILSIFVFLIGISISTTKELTGVLMNSLPTKKVEIVGSRFIFMIINTLIITLYLLLVSYLLRNKGQEVYILNGNNILAFFNIGFSTLAILMPIGFFNDRGLDVAAMIIFFITLWFGWLIWRTALLSPLYGAVVTITLLVLSYLLSKQLFNEKEFD